MLLQYSVFKMKLEEEQCHLIGMSPFKEIDEKDHKKEVTLAAAGKYMT